MQAPIKTIAEAMTRGTYAGGVFALKTGETWTEKLTVSGSGSVGLPITFSKYDSTGDALADPIIDSTGSVIDFNSKDYIVLDNLEVRNGLIVVSGDNNIIRYSKIDSADANAITMAGATNSIYYNLILNATTDAIQISGATNTIYNNVIYGNGNGFDVDESVTIKNNIVNTSGTDDINITGAKTVTGGSNIFEDAAIVGAGTYSGSALFSTDPLFTVAGSDFTLKAGSPAINAGVDVGLTLDFLGNPIVGLPDIGAYESNFALGNIYKRRVQRLKWINR